MVATAFEDVQEASDVAAHIHVRVCRCIAHTRLGGEVDHALRFVRRKRCLDRSTVGEIRRDMSIVRVILESRQARFFQVHIVVIAEVVKADDLIPAIEKPHCNCCF